MEAVLRHPVFSPAVQAADNHFIQRRFTLTARRLVLKVLPGNTIFGSAVQATDNDLF
jgi:CHASE1-domain containing sensor protein